MYWIAFFSQTGSEIYEISKRLGRFPDKIVTNRRLLDTRGDTPINPKLFKKHTGAWCMVSDRPNVDGYTYALSVNDIKIPYQDVIITLHGWLRILPPEICNDSKYQIFNGHPGDIITYPELKGFNPQKKAHDLKLSTSGSVIHKVTSEVDCGEIVAHKEIDIKGMTLDEIYKKLHCNSVELWYNFLHSKI